MATLIFLHISTYSLRPDISKYSCYSSYSAAQATRVGILSLIRPDLCCVVPVRYALWSRQSWSAPLGWRAREADRVRVVRAAALPFRHPVLVTAQRQGQTQGDETGACPGSTSDFRLHLSCSESEVPP